MTACPDLMANPRRIWLSNNGYREREVVVTHEKDKYINELNINIHIDDKLDTIKDIADNCPDCTGILYLPEYLEYSDEAYGIDRLKELRRYDEKNGKDLGVTEKGNFYPIVRNIQDLNALVNNIIGIRKDA